VRLNQVPTIKSMRDGNILIVGKNKFQSIPLHTDTYTRDHNIFVSNKRSIEQLVYSRADCCYVYDIDQTVSHTNAQQYVCTHLACTVLKQPCLNQLLLPLLKQVSQHLEQ